MANYIYSIVLLGVALVAIEIRKSYHAIPKRELKYRAKEGDQLAAKIYSAISYEESLELLLWLIIVLSVTGCFVLFYSVAPFWLDFIAIALFLWLAFAWLPKTTVTSFSSQITNILTPAILLILNYLHPLFSKVTAKQGRSVKVHTGLYDTKDLVKLITAQQKQEDSRINPDKLALVKKALTLQDKTLGEYCQTWSSVQHVQASEAIRPVLLDELHKSKQLFVPVVANEGEDKVVGMVDLRRIDLSKTGEIKEIMDQNIYYLKEDDTLYDALIAMSESGHQVFIVIDKKKRLFGIITLKDVLSHLVNLKGINRDYSQIDDPVPLPEEAEIA